jgi:hypothetical protein
MAKRKTKAKRDAADGRYRLKVGGELQMVYFGRRLMQAYVPVHRWALGCPCGRPDCPNAIEFKTYIN